MSGPPWAYQPDENPKRRHAWGNPYPGVVEVDGEPIGKCPNDVSAELAQQLLNEGLPWHRPRGPAGGWPDAIYIVYKGAVYRAKPTNAGASYHAYPETGARLRELGRVFVARILDRARELGCEEEVRRWIRS